MKRLGLLVVLLALSTPLALGQILTFEFSALAGGEASAGSNFNDANLTSSTITRGSGVTAGANASRFNSTNWTTGTLDATDYVEFTITPNANKKFSITDIVMLHQRSGTGPTGFAIRSSVDSYAADLATQTGTDVTTTQTATFTFSQTDLSVATTYRIYAYTAEAGTGTWGPGDGTGNDIVVNGSTGDLTASEPTTQASAVNFTSVGTNGFTVNWTSGDGASRIVLVKSESAVDGTPTDNNGYNADAVFGAGAQIGTGNYVVHSGSGSSVAVSGLFASTTYHVAVFEYNGSAGGANYLTSSSATGSQATNAPSGSSSSNIISAGNETGNLDYAAKQASSITATTDAVRVWSFTIQDGGGSADGDPLSTELTDVTIGKGGSNGVSSWANTVRRAALYDGSTEVAEVDVTGETIAFTGLSGANVNAADDGSKTLDLYFTFETGVTDNIQYQFLVTLATANASGSLFATADGGAASSSITGDANRIEVTATKLLFVQQPSAVNTGAAMTPAVTVEATDGNNLRDLDYVTDANITATGATLTGSPVAATPSSGLATFSTLTFTTAAAGVTLSVGSGSLTGATSNAFTVTAAPVTHSIPFSEDFDYSIGQLTSAGGGANVSSSNWVNTSGTTYIPTVSGNLTKTNYSTGTGNMIEVSNARSEDIRANFTSQSADGSKLYTSFLINLTNTTGLNGTGDYFAHYLNVSGVTNGGFHARTFIRTSAGGFQFGIVANSGGTTQWTTAEYVTGTTYLVVVGYEIVTGTANNVARLWILPTVPVAEPAADLTSTSTADPDVIDAFGIRQTTTTPNASIDAIKVANVWETPLPVQLSSFAATANRLNASLVWHVESETQNAGFEVERKQIPTDKFQNSDWQLAGFVAGGGTSNQARDYSFTDANLAPGRYAYRIKQIDKEGSFRYYGNAEVEIGLAAKSFTLSDGYPNPFNPTTRIEFTVAENVNTNLKVYNMLGQEVATLFNGLAEAGRIHQVNFNAAQLPSGLYFARLESGTVKMMKKLMLVR